MKIAIIYSLMLSFFCVTLKKIRMPVFFFFDRIGFHCMDKNNLKYSLKYLLFCSTEYIVIQVLKKMRVNDDDRILIFSTINYFQLSLNNV